MSVDKEVIVDTVSQARFPPLFLVPNIPLVLAKKSGLIQAIAIAFRKSCCDSIFYQESQTPY